MVHVPIIGLLTLLSPDDGFVYMVWLHSGIGLLFDFLSVRKASTLTLQEYNPSVMIVNSPA